MYDKERWGRKHRHRYHGVPARNSPYVRQSRRLPACYGYTGWPFARQSFRNTARTSHIGATAL